MPAYTPPATVTCCGKLWHTWKRSWRHTTSSECGNRPLNTARIREIRPMFDGVYEIVLAEGTLVTSSRRCAHKLRAVLECSPSRDEGLVVSDCFGIRTQVC